MIKKHNSVNIEKAHESNTDIGRCDLMPFYIISRIFNEDYELKEIFNDIDMFESTGDVTYLYHILNLFIDKHFENPYTASLDLSIYYELYDKNNDTDWHIDITISTFINSAIKHLLKFYRGDSNERHDVAFLWNIIGAIWTMQQNSDMDDFTYLSSVSNNEDDSDEV